MTTRILRKRAGHDDDGNDSSCDSATKAMITISNKYFNLIIDINLW